MELEAIYENQDDIPEAFRPLYTEREGKWELTQVKGIKTQTDIDKLQTSLGKERTAHGETKAKLKVFDGLDAEQITKDQDELKEARIRIEAIDNDPENKGGKLDEEQINKLVEARVATQMAPINREMETLKATNAEQAETIQGHEKKDTVRTITDAVREAGTTSKIIETAMDDVLMLSERIFEVTDDGHVITKDGVGATPGIEPDIWLSEMQEKRPHWWPAAEGGGAKGGQQQSGFPDNPFTFAHWNMTKQGEIVKSDPAKAERMAKAAGVTIGSMKPAPPQQKSA